MTTDAAAQNIALMRRFIKEVQQDGHIELLSEFLSDQMFDHTAAPGMPSGIEGGKAILAMLHSKLKDIKVDIEHCISDGDVVATNKVLNARLVEDFHGVTAHGQRIRFRIMDWVKVVDGKFTEHWANVGAVEEISD